MTRGLLTRVVRIVELPDGRCQLVVGNDVVATVATRQMADDIKEFLQRGGISASTTSIPCGPRSAVGPSEVKHGQAEKQETERV